MKKSIFSSLLALALSLGAQAGYAIPTESITDSDLKGRRIGRIASSNMVRGTHNPRWAYSRVSPYRGKRMAVMSPDDTFNSRAYDRPERERGADPLISEPNLPSIPLSDAPLASCASTEAVEPDQQSDTDTGQDALDASCTTDSTIAEGDTFITTGLIIQDVRIANLDYMFDVDNAWRAGGDPSAVPAPGTLALFAIGLLGLAGVRRRQATLVS